MSGTIDDSTKRCYLCNEYNCLGDFPEDGRIGMKCLNCELETCPNLIYSFCIECGQKLCEYYCNINTDAHSGLHDNECFSFTCKKCAGFLCKDCVRWHGPSPVMKPTMFCEKCKARKKKALRNLDLFARHVRCIAKLQLWKSKSLKKLYAPPENGDIGGSGYRGAKRHYDEISTK